MTELTYSPAPVVEVTLSEPPVVEIAAIGAQGPAGPTGPGVVFLDNPGDPVPPDTPVPSLIVEPLP